jgi:CDP-paratose 2-epimerase
MKILITGGAGFIGSNLADHYLKRGFETVVYDDLSRQGVEKNLAWLKETHPKLVFHKSDIRDFEKLKKAMQGAFVVYHMASQVAVTSSVKSPLKDFGINALGTLLVLEAARAQKSPPIVIFASTNKVYGGMENIDLIEKRLRYDFKDKSLKKGIAENFNLDFHSPYGCSKGAADQYTHDYARIYGLKTIVFRQSCIYGTRQFGNEDQGWVAHFAIRALQGKPITIFGDGKQVRDLLYIDDLIDCFLKAIKNIKKTSGQVYNIGGGRKYSVSLLELISLLEDKLGKKIKFKFRDWRPGDQKIYISDVRKAKKDFGWMPTTSVSNGLNTLLKWLRSIE